LLAPHLAHRLTCAFVQAVKEAHFFIVSFVDASRQFHLLGRRL
jgi:hypothetical protein